MDTSFKLGRVLGIEVGGSWSLLIILVLIAYTVATAVLPNQISGQSATAYWIYGGLTAVLFMASLLAHELGHSVLARRRGLKVSGITLWMFGGVSRFEGEAPTAGAEGQIAAIGPAISLVLGIVFLILAALLPKSLAAASLGWLGLMNVFLAIFNSLPAFPLDGGRVLSAVLWRRSGDRVRAIVSAARVGRVLAGLMIAAGLAQFLFGLGISGLWLTFLGWFLLSAARAEETGVKLRRSLQGVRVADVMSAPVIVVPDWITVAEFLSTYASAHHVSTFPTRSFEGRLSGVLRLRSVVRVPAPQRRSVRVRDIATPLAEVPRASPDELLVDVIPRMQAPGDGRVLVMAGDELAGILSPADVARAVHTAETAGRAA